MYVYRLGCVPVCLYKTRSPYGVDRPKGVV